MVRVTWPHWVAVGALSAIVLVVALLRYRKKTTPACNSTSIYRAIILALLTFVGLFLLDVTVFARYFSDYPRGCGIHLNFDFGRLFRTKVIDREEAWCNILVFIPFGLAVAERLAVRRPAAGRNPGPFRILGLATLSSFCLSLLIEGLQLALKVGFFETTDLVMNTLGGLIGACLSLLLRAIFRPSKN